MPLLPYDPYDDATPGIIELYKLRIEGVDETDMETGDERVPENEFGL